jgi:hydroxymethylpyrimidine pyrophosphatase-like HAD family hydrolase
MHKPQPSNTVFVFDLDGVITDPTTTTVDTTAIGRIHQLLENGRHLAINTGRSFVWVKENLLSVLEKLDTAQHFDRLLIVCEKGGECIEWQAEQFVPRPSRFALPKDLQEQAHQLLETHKDRFTSMFWDDTKLTMASYEKYPDAPMQQFTEEQRQLETLLHDTFSGQHIKLVPTISALDIELPEAGKHAGAELIHAWIAEQTHRTDQAFISFGDSKSDYEMARYFAEQGNSSTFVFVGLRDITFNESLDVELLRTTASFAAGTREYFEAHGEHFSAIGA